MDLARRMWTLTEPLHAVVYFAPEHRRAQDAAGLKGGWMAYFASRSAPLGPVPAAVVTAVFYNFAPSMVARAIPDAWRLAGAARVLEARYAAVRQVLARILGAAAEPARLEPAVALLRSATQGCAPAGRPLFAANLALPWPDDPVAGLWHGATLLREHRGDGHVSALLSHELDGCQAHVLAAAAGRSPAEQLRANRGWSEEQWEDAAARLRDRGVLTAAGTWTEAGRALHGEVEDLTDRLASPPWDELGSARAADLAAALEPLVARVRAAGAVPYPNPIGLQAPS